jgi:hypothetical protein
MADTQRYWDGERWTDHIAPGAPAPASSPVAVGVSNGLIAGGVLSALLIPFVGFILGIVLLAKNESSGWLVLLLSLASAALWYNAFS